MSIASQCVVLLSFCANGVVLPSFSFCIHRQKGSDASWEHDIEPPEEHLDYSDDEEERAARKRLQDRRRTEAKGEGQEETPTVTEERTEKKSECLCMPSVFRLFVWLHMWAV